MSLPHRTEAGSIVPREAAEADLVAVVVAVDRLADAVRVRLALGRLQSPRVNVRDERIEVLDDDRDQRAAGATRILLDVDRPLVGQRPDDLARVGEERRLTQKLLVPRT